MITRAPGAELHGGCCASLGRAVRQADACNAQTAANRISLGSDALLKLFSASRNPLSAACSPGSSAVCPASPSCKSIHQGALNSTCLRIMFTTSPSCQNLLQFSFRTAAHHHVHDGAQLDKRAHATGRDGGPVRCSGVPSQVPPGQGEVGNCLGP